MIEHYQVRVLGAIDRHWAGWFADMAIGIEPGSGSAPITVLTGPIADQAALRGLLTRLWDLNLTLLSVIRVESDTV